MVDDEKKSAFSNKVSLVAVCDLRAIDRRERHNNEYHAVDLTFGRRGQKALSLWIKGATFQQIAAAGFGIATASGA